MGVMADPLISTPYVIATDEVGFGSWAGALYVCAVLMPTKWDGKTAKGLKVRDSKKMSARDRDAVYQWALDAKIPHWVVIKTPEQIDEFGARKALIAAHLDAHRLARAAAKVSGWDVTVIADGNLPLEGAVSLPKADDLIPAVSLASCIAKVLRDHVMVAAGAIYPGYGFETNVGYGTQTHQDGLDRLGPCAIHRMSYGPVKKAAENKTGVKFGWEG